MERIGMIITEQTKLKSLTGEEKERIRKQIEEEDRRLALEAINENKQNKLRTYFDSNSLINRDLQKATFDNYAPSSNELQRALEVSKRYVNTFTLDKPKNLLFTGTYGTGKSHLSVAITKALMEKGFTSIFISMPKLHTAIKATYGSENKKEYQIMKVLEEVDLLVLDDIGAESDTDWAIIKLFEILDSRAGKHTIFTTNLNQRELKEHLKERNYSRFMHNTFEIKMVGQDWRLKK